MAFRFLKDTKMRHEFAQRAGHGRVGGSWHRAAAVYGDPLRESWARHCAGQLRHFGQVIALCIKDEVVYRCA